MICPVCGESMVTEPYESVGLLYRPPLPGTRRLVTEPYESVGLLYYSMEFNFRTDVTEPYESVGLLYTYRGAQKLLDRSQNPTNL